MEKKRIVSLLWFREENGRIECRHRFARGVESRYRCMQIDLYGEMSLFWLYSELLCDHSNQTIVGENASHKRTGEWQHKQGFTWYIDPKHRW